ncbi:MAG: CocE/NonD family hydrolase [Pseudomonadota bacterium]
MSQRLVTRFRSLTNGLILVALLGAISACTEDDESVGVRFAGPFEGEGTLERPQGAFEMAPVETLMAPMRDGVQLATDVYRPLGKDANEAILIRTPYNKANFAPEVSRNGTVEVFVTHGYTVLVQDTRGRFGSEGAFAPAYRDDTDSYDTMDWAIEQAWSNGVLGTFGCSYLGENQITAAGLRHPAWKAAIPMASGGANGGVEGRNKPFALWNGGAFELAMGYSWFADNGGTTGVDGPGQIEAPDADARAEALFTLPLNEALRAISDKETQYEEYVSNHPGKDYWQQFPFLKGDEDISVPALFIESWYDYGPQETFAQLTHFQKRSGDLATAHRVVMDPGLHCRQHTLTDATVIGERPLGDARFDFFGLYLGWFDYWLKGEANGIENLPLLTYYKMGTNEWHTSDAWPLETAEMTPYYFDDGDTWGGLTKERPAQTAEDAFLYDPLDPLPTRGASVCCTLSPNGESLEGAFDHVANEERPDVLIYETAPLTEAVDVTGPVSVHLFVSSDAPDTDFTAKLMDVYPDGRSFNIVDNLQRMRWRDGYEAPQFMEPGKVYPVTIDLQATSNVFLEGHKIRVEISSSNFPRFSRNLNTGEDNHLTTATATARNVVHRGDTYASHILLPINRETAQ